MSELRRYEATLVHKCGENPYMVMASADDGDYCEYQQAANEITCLRQLLSEAEKREREARAKAVEDVLSALTAHELYQYRPKAFQGFIEYARREFGSTPVRKPAVDSGESGDE